MAVLRSVAVVFLAGLTAAAAPQPADKPMLRVPSMPEGQLVHQVDPEYPPAALQRRIQGTVQFTAVIGKDGHIEQLHLISGHSLLVHAANQAAKQWIYRPTLLGDKPVRVITHIDVHFQLDPYGKPLKHDNRESNRRAAL